MRRRLATLLTAALLGATLVLPLTAMPALAAGETVVLATEGAGSDAGLEPKPADATENEFAPAEYEANVTWRAGLYIFALVLLAAVATGLLYYVRVHRPAARSQQS